jgi:hypothetical protein
VAYINKRMDAALQHHAAMRFLVLARAKAR